MNTYPFPIYMNLKGKEICVIGGGNVATRKIKQLMHTGAILKIISPEITKTIEDIIDNQYIYWVQKEVEETDIFSAFIIIIATNNESINRKILKWKLPHQLINNATYMETSDFHIPGMIQRGDLCITVSTNGASPFLTKKIKDELADQYDDSYIEYVTFLKYARKTIFLNVTDIKKRRVLLQIIAEKSFYTNPLKEDNLELLINNALKEV